MYSQDLPPTRDTWIYTPAPVQLSSHPVVLALTSIKHNQAFSHNASVKALNIRWQRPSVDKILENDGKYIGRKTDRALKTWQPVSCANPRIRHFLEPGHVFMATDLAVEAAGNFLLQMSQPYDARLYLTWTSSILNVLWMDLDVLRFKYNLETGIQLLSEFCSLIPGREKRRWSLCVDARCTSGRWGGACIFWRMWVPFTNARSHFDPP